MAKYPPHWEFRSVCITVCVVVLASTIIYGFSAQAGVKLADSPTAMSSFASPNQDEGGDHSNSPHAKSSVASQHQGSMIAGPLRAVTQDPGLPGPNQVVIRRPQGPPTIELTEPDPLGRVGRVTCSACHSIRAPDFNNQSVAQLDEFHQGMTFTHGQLTCYSCHNPDHSDALRLADGRTVQYADVMQLCAQCHGKKSTDFEHGIHGGMTGYWDLRRGGRVRNNCIDCHDPHAPKFPTMQPTFKPRERFAAPSHKADHGHESFDPRH